MTHVLHTCIYIFVQILVRPDLALNFNYRYMDGVLSINSPYLINSSHEIPLYPNELAKEERMKLRAADLLRT